MLITGGTGIAARDKTFETVSGLLTKRCPATASCSACSATTTSAPPQCSAARSGGVLNNVIILTMPGSTAAVQLAMEKLIVPEIGHLVYEARK